VGLVYIAAFGPDRDESVNQIVSRYEPAEWAKYLTRGPAGEWIQAPEEESWRAIAWDVPEEIRRIAQHEKQVASNDIFTQTNSEPAWSTRPSWYLVASSDNHLRPEIQRFMAERMGATVDEVDTSHAVAHAAPQRVVDIIGRALDALAPAAN
jgi:hypothetical protein